MISLSKSNIIKSVYFNVDPGQKKIIDSDDRVEQFIPDIYTQKESAEEAYHFQQFGNGSADGEEGEFQDGLSVIHMDDVIEEERQKLSQEISQEVQQETERQVQQMLKDAREEAEQILAGAREEAEEIRSQAEAEGHETGLTQGMVVAKNKLQEMQVKLKEEFEEKHRELEEQERQMEPFFAELTADLVEKITGIICQDKKEVILYLIERAMEHLERSKQITIRVSKEDMAAVAMQKMELKEAAEGIEEFDVVEDSNLMMNQCIIETENRIIDCSLDVQLQSLRDQIRMLAM